MLDNQFFNVKDWYFATKGVFYRRFGTTAGLSASDAPLASKLTAIHRHYSPNREKYTIYHAEPNSTAISNSMADLTLTEIAGGDLFNGGAVEVMRVCYSWLSCGIEQNYNSRLRAGFPALPVAASANPAHQSITVANNTKAVRVTVPAFPSGVRGANIFAARGANTEMTYVGTVTTSGGTLDIKHFISGPVSAAADAFGGTTTVSASYSATGALKPGLYYVSLAWLTNMGIQEGGVMVGWVGTCLQAATPVVVGTGQNSITVSHNHGPSANGATSTYVFIGTKTDREAPMVVAGIIKPGQNLEIDSIPDNSNAQSHPDPTNPVSTVSKFDPMVRAGSTARDDRFGFLLKKNWDSGVVSEIFPSRSLYAMNLALTTDPIYGSPNVNSIYSSVISTPNDKAGSPSTQPYNYGRTVYKPQLAYFNGMSYIVNGKDMIGFTDGKVFGRVVPKNGTLLPPYPRFISVFENQLLVAGAEAKNQVFACNSNDPQNWAVGGAGTNKRFVSIGDLFGDECTAHAVFSRTPDAVNDPRSFFIAFKKNACWMKDTFPDPSGTIGAPMEELSGRVGCVAHRTIKSTTSGLMFLGSDGDVYLIRDGGKPLAVGGTIKPLLEHLAKSDTLALMATAVFHDSHYKLSYPSSLTSTMNDAQLWADLRTEGGAPITWVGPHTGLNIGDQLVNAGESDDMRRECVRMDAVGSGILDDTTVHTDFGVAISPVIESKTFRFRSEAHLKRILGMIAEAFYDSQYSHEVLFELFAGSDYARESRVLSEGGAIWNSANWDEGGRYSDELFEAITWNLSPEQNLNGRTCKFKITHIGAAQFALTAVIIPYIPERRLVL